MRKPWVSAHTPPIVTGLLKWGPASRAARGAVGTLGTESPAEAMGPTWLARALIAGPGGGPQHPVGVSPALLFKVRHTPVLLPGPLLTSTLGHCPLATAARLAEGSQGSRAPGGVFVGGGRCAL